MPISANGMPALPGCLAVVAMLVASGPVPAADFDAGSDAFRAKNYQQAIDEWQPLADSGHPEAQYALGRMFEYGYGFDRDDAEAAEWYQKAAEQNVRDAQYRLGVLHDNGWGVARDAELAVRWYSRAAHLGHVFAQHDLAFMYVNGTGVPQDNVQAYKWLRVAVEQRADLMAKHLSSVSKSMTSAEIRKAERLAWACLTSQDI